ncbi:ABC transporter ATP-binding protein [Pseudoduganella plicata]|uniref:ABC transporter ATP-binding protein n=1 Tax=Pseudoduganella plicata TaxID=321984 RepID=A0A4P7BFY8_9BURK|nr:ABC transporter ATP-binding protein [Pseudoduganella plicata]QBQ37170.1 ABC transporter ATP-binding protein [Pseudoduganella plicata]GGY98786.1 ABC transporter ATP-binding protein [Pseudoduganella plicata]
MIKLSRLNKVYATDDVLTTALSDIDLTIEQGDFVAVTGPSGCGKSTLLSLLGFLDVPDSGEYWFNGRNVAGLPETQLNTLRRGGVGFIFQNFNLIDELSAYENIELALKYSGKPAHERRARIEAVLDKLGVLHRRNHRPSQLSGGQQQRVAIARALVAEPALLLADEPTGNLDSAHGAEVMAILARINEEGTTIVMVTHSPEHAARARRIVRLHDGRVQEDQVDSPLPSGTSDALPIRAVAAAR